MRLSAVASKELKELLRKEIGVEAFQKFDDEAILDLGSRLLRLTAVALKRRRQK